MENGNCLNHCSAVLQHPLFLGWAGLGAVKFFLHKILNSKTSDLRFRRQENLEIVITRWIKCMLFSLYKASLDLLPESRSCSMLRCVEDASSHELMGELCEPHVVTFTFRVCLLASNSACYFLEIEEVGTSRHTLVEWKRTGSSLACWF